MNVSPDEMRPVCVCCQERPAADLTREGDLFYGGYDSDYDLMCFAAIREVPCPQGDICNDCMKDMLDSGAVIHVRTLGTMEHNLPAAAHAALFRGARDYMLSLLNSGKSPVEILLKAYPARDHDPVGAGMLSALMNLNGMDVTDADKRYGQAIQAEDELLAAMLSQVEEELGQAS